MTTLKQIEQKKLQKMLKDYPYMSEGTVNLVTKSNNESFKVFLQQKPIETRLSLSLSNESMDSEWINKKELLKELNQ